MPVEHLVDCSAAGTNHVAIDREVAEEDIAWRDPPSELRKDVQAERDERRRAALRRLQRSALSDPELADLLTVLGVEDE